MIRTAPLFGIGTTAFLFTISVQNLIFTNPAGLANPTKQCESLAEGVAASDEPLFRSTTLLMLYFQALAAQICVLQTCPLAPLRMNLKR